MIPQTIHYVRLGDDPRPDVTDWCFNSVRSLHPDWAIRSVTDVDVPAIFDHPTAVDSGLPFRAFYDRIAAEYSGRHSPKAIRADLLKVLAVYVYGGFSLDLDMYCCQPLDRFRNDDVVLGVIRPALVSEAIIGGRAGCPKMGYILRRYVEGQNPASGICFMELYARSVELNLTPYPSEVFIPHNRTDAGELLYRHTADTHFIHIWKKHEYDRERIEGIAAELRKGKVYG